VTLQPVHLVGESVNVIQVTSQGPCGEYVHQIEMFSILQYVVKLVIKPIISSPISRQLALTWQAVCIQIVVRGLKCYHPSMKIMWSLNTVLWQILSVYIMCQCDLNHWPIFPKIGSRDPEGVMCFYLEVYGRLRIWNMRL